MKKKPKRVLSVFLTLAMVFTILGSNVGVVFADSVVAAPELNATASKGTSAGSTKVTATLGASNHKFALLVASSHIATPNVGDLLPNGNIIGPYISNTDITGVDAVNNKYIGMYEVDSNYRVVGFKLITLTRNDINYITPPELNASVAPGANLGTSKVSVTVGLNHQLAIEVSSSSITLPSVGELKNISSYKSGDDITGVDLDTKKYIGVYELDNNNQVVKFKLITLVDGDIRGNIAPELTVGVSKGTSAGSTKLNVTANAENYLVVKVSSTTIYTPNLGGPLPTGGVITNPYTSGGDITGVDSVHNKYVGVYVMDNKNKVVSFKLITLSENDISTQTPPTIVSTKTDELGEKVIITFDKAMNDPVGKHGQFVVKVGQGTNAVKSASLNVNSSIIELILTTPIVHDDVVTVDYLLGTITSFDGGILAGFTNHPVTNTVLKTQAFNPSAWQIYSHTGNWGESYSGKNSDGTLKPPIFPNGDDSPLGKEHNQHIVIRNGGERVSFYGYGKPGYKDFILLPSSSEVRKVFTFNLDMSGINYHSMEGGGMLFNAKLINGLLSGYALLFVEYGIKLYELTDVDANAFHESENGAFTCNGSRNTAISGIKEVETFTPQPGNNHELRLEVSPNQVDLWDNGVKVVNGYTLITPHGDGIGLIASYLSHGCSDISYFTFQGLKIKGIDVVWPILDLAVVPGDGGVADLTFSAPNSATGVVLQQSTDGVNYTNSVVGTPLDTNSTSTHVTGLIANKNYYFRLVVTGGINAGFSNVAKITAPFALTGVSSSVSIPNTVSATSNRNGTLYLVLKSAAEEFNNYSSQNDLQAAVQAGKGSKIVDIADQAIGIPTIGLAAGTYVVYAVDSEGNLAAKSPNVTLVATPPYIPPAPTPDPTPKPEQTTVKGDVIDKNGQSVKGVDAQVSTETNGNKTVEVKSKDAILLKQPDGTKAPLSDVSKLKLEVKDNAKVSISSDGTIQVKDLAKGTETKISVTYDLGNGQKICMGTMEVKVDSNGNVSLTSTLIDPYGTITDAATGKVIEGADVKLYYANTERNKVAGKTPDNLVQLPIIEGFKPNNNKNPQISDVNGAYGFMVFPTTDYYIVATKDGYNEFKSPTIPVEQDIVKLDFKMNKPSTGLNRLSGLNRIDTAIEIAKASYTGKLSNVILATADGYSDALAGSVLAYKLNAPILLVGSSVADQEKVLAYIKANMDAAGNVYILGGTGVVSSTFEANVVASGFKNITRFGGANRYETSLKIAEKLDTKLGSPVVLAYGEDYPDALSISSTAAVMQYPILLVQKNGMSDAVKQKLAEIKPIRTYIIGLEGVIGTTIEDQAAQATGLDKANIVRIGGQDRYETSLAIAKYFGLNGQNICIATGNDYPDAIAGSVYAANSNSPIILTGGNLSENTINYLKTRKMTGATIFGGEAVVSKEIENDLMEIVVGKK